MIGTTGIWIGGLRASLGDLKTGTTVQVAYQRGADGMIAQSVIPR